jgi:ribosome-binding protein aMBF1 (putative translation factor)
MFAHQDWTPVIFKKTNNKPQVQGQQHHQNEPHHLKQLEEDDVVAPKVFERSYIQEVIKKRTERKWNQKQLATALNVDVHKIQRFEHGNEVYDHQFKHKLNRVLGISSK